MGLTDPGDLRPYNLMRRVSSESVKPLNEVYDYLMPGDLLGSKIPKQYAIYWKLANADSF